MQYNSVLLIMKMKFLFALSLLLCLFSAVKAEDNWELRRDESGITIYSRRSADGKLVELRVLCQFNATPAQVIKQLFDIDNYANWVYGNKRTGIIKKINEQDIIYFTEAHLPWPIQDRDLVIELTQSPATATTPLIVKAKSLPAYLPLKKHFIRVPYSLATWRISPAPGNKSKIDYTFSLDPGGSIPVWLVNLNIATGPFKSFIKLEDILKAAKN
jgi:hypothetical protein